MNFVHLKIFSNDLDTELIRETLQLSPDVIGKPSETEKGRMMSWSYTEEADDESLNGVIDNLIRRLYEKKEFIAKLSEFKNDVYLVIAHYVETYQKIISIDSSLLSKLGEMKIELVIDIMAP